MRMVMMKMGFDVVVFCPLGWVRHQEQLKPSDSKVQSNEELRTRVLIFLVKNTIFSGTFFLVSPCKGRACVTCNFFRSTFVCKQDIASFHYPKKTPKLENLGYKNLSPGVLRGGAPGTSKVGAGVSRREVFFVFFNRPLKPLATNFETKNASLGGFGPSDQRGTPHPIYIQNMRFLWKNFFWWKIKIMRHSEVRNVMISEQAFAMLVFKYKYYFAGIFRVRGTPSPAPLRTKSVK